MENAESVLNISVTWRGNKYSIELNSDGSLKDLGDELQKLTDVKPDTMKLIVPQVSGKGSKLLSPFSNEHSQLSLQKASILKGKSIRMMGVPEDEVDKVLQNAKANLRIAGFDEEERRMKQRSAYSPHALLKLPQGPYTFCEFRTLQLPGIQLNPPASEALKRMHMLAADPGIVAIMNKHHWRVGIMTEMAPVGYVGVSPKCLLGFNKNHGEEISLRLRTDDLKGFRKYESIKKTLLHELAHMVYSEHDANFYNLDKQLNQEAASLDWTKSRGHTLNGVRHLDHYEEEESFDSDNRSFSYKLGGNVSDQMASARTSSVAAAYRRLANESANGSGASRVYEEPDPDDSRISTHDRPEANYVGEENTDIESAHKIQFKPDHEPDPDEYSYVQSKDEPDPDDSQNNNLGLMGTLNNLIELGKTVDEPDPDDSEVKVRDVNIQGPNQDNSLKIRSRKGRAHLDKVYGEPDPDEFQADRTVQVEPDPDDDLAASQEISSMKIDESMIIDEPDPDDSYAKQSNSRHRNIEGADQNNPPLTESIEDAACPNKASREPDPDESQANSVVRMEPDPDESQANSVVRIEPDPDDGLLASQEISNMKIDEPDPDDEEIRRIQDPVAVVCGRLQKAVETLRAEVGTAEATATLQTLFKIIRNVIEHPYEMKFKRLRKANPIIQKNVANHRAALEILQMVGFIEDVLLDETGKAETCLVLKRNDPGLLWLAKSSLEACLAF